MRLLGARIGGQLDARRATLRNDTGPALVAEGLLVDGDLVLSGYFTATGSGKKAVVRLASAQIGGRLFLNPEAARNTTHPRARWDVDGLTYTGQPEGASVPEWLQLLREATGSYAAQPYRHLAAAAQAAGHDGHVRKILMNQRRDQLDLRAVTSKPERAWAKLTGWTLGYGYQPWRALLFLLFAVAIAVAIALLGGAHGGLQHTSSSFSPNTPCTVVERIGVGLDLGLPLIRTGARDYCAATHTTLGDTVAVAGWTVQLAAWAFATLFVAGFTGAVRKT